MRSVRRVHGIVLDRIFQGKFTRAFKGPGQRFRRFPEYQYLHAVRRVHRRLPDAGAGFCPSASMFFNGDKQTEPFKCIACGICARKCPTGALEIINVPAKA